MAREDEVTPEQRRLLEAAGYDWNKSTQVWANRHAGRAVSPETVRRWTLDELRDWLSRDGTKG
jgi:hypothetical protein